MYGKTHRHLRNNQQYMGISWKTGYLLRNVDAGIREFAGMGLDDVRIMQTDESQMMMSCGSHTSQSHKSITQMNRTKQDDVMSRNGNDEPCFWMLQSNSGVYGQPETGSSNRNMSKSKG